MLLLINSTDSQNSMIIISPEYHWKPSKQRMLMMDILMEN